MKKSNTMLQNEITEVMPSKKEKLKRKLKIAVCIIAPILCALAALVFMNADIPIEYSDLEGGITVEEYNGYVLFKAHVTEVRGLAFSYDFSNGDPVTHIAYIGEKICIHTERYKWWFGKKQERIIYVISNDGREQHFESHDVEKALATEYKYEENDSQESHMILNELTYCKIKNREVIGEETLLWKLDHDE